MKPFCPRCGYDLHNDAPIFLNGYAMRGPYTPLLYNGAVVALTGAEQSLCWTLMKAYPDPVTREVVKERMGTEATGNVLDVFLSRIRKKLKAIGAPIPFQSVRARNGHSALVWVL